MWWKGVKLEYHSGDQIRRLLYSLLRLFESFKANFRAFARIGKDFYDLLGLLFQDPLALHIPLFCSTIIRTSASAILPRIIFHISHCRLLHCIMPSFY